VPHPAAEIRPGTLVQRCCHLRQPIRHAGSKRPGIVHRLTKTQRAARGRKERRAHRKMSAPVRRPWHETGHWKRAIGLVWGVPDARRHARCSIDLAGPPKARDKMAVSEGGRRRAICDPNWERLETYPVCEVRKGLVLTQHDLCRWRTGRTHQITLLVHLFFLIHGQSMLGSVRIDWIKDEIRVAAAA